MDAEGVHSAIERRMDRCTGWAEEIHPDVHGAALSG